jgi:hypothetical protein
MIYYHIAVQTVPVKIKTSVLSIDSVTVDLTPKTAHSIPTILKYIFYFTLPHTIK